MKQSKKGKKEGTLSHRAAHVSTGCWVPSRLATCSELSGKYTACIPKGRFPKAQIGTIFRPPTYTHILVHIYTIPYHRYMYKERGGGGHAATTKRKENETERKRRVHTVPLAAFTAASAACMARPVVGYARPRVPVIMAAADCTSQTAHSNLNMPSILAFFANIKNKKRALQISRIANSTPQAAPPGLAAAGSCASP